MSAATHQTARKSPTVPVAGRIPVTLAESFNAANRRHGRTTGQGVARAIAFYIRHHDEAPPSRYANQTATRP
jgi:hypothetical protein